jgi:tetratricopeptide (TPR) repeat protein
MKSIRYAILLTIGCSLAACAPLATHPGTAAKAPGQKPAAAQADIPAGKGQGEGLSNADAMVLYMEAITLKGDGDLRGALEAATKASAADPRSASLMVLVAELSVALRNSDEAQIWAERALALDAGEIDALRILARVYTIRQEREKAAEVYRRMIEVDPENREAYLHLGGNLMESGKTEEARKVFESLLTVDPSMHIAHHFIGRIHLERNELEKARDSFEKAVALQSGFTAAWNLLGSVKEMLRDFAGAAEAYGKVLDRDPHNLGVLRRLGAIELDLGREDAALKHFQGIVAREPKDLAARLSLGLIYSRKGDYARGLQEMRAARELASDKLSVDLSIADLLEEMGEVEQTRALLEGLLKENPGETEVVVRMAGFLHARKEHQGAVDLLSGLLGSEADQPHLRTQISLIYRQMKRYDEAKSFMESSLAKFPEAPSLLFELAVVEDQRKDFPATEAALRRTIAAKADHASALNYLGYLFAERGVNLEESVDLVKRALAIDPENGYFLDSLGWAYYKQGRLTEAKRELEKAIGRSPKDPVILDHLGDVHRDLGDFPLAVKRWRQSLEIDAGQVELQRKIEGILAVHPSAGDPPSEKTP